MEPRAASQFPQEFHSLWKSSHPGEVVSNAVSATATGQIIAQLRGPASPFSRPLEGNCKSIFFYNLEGVTERRPEVWRWRSAHLARRSRNAKGAPGGKVACLQSARMACPRRAGKVSLRPGERRVRQTRICKKDRADFTSGEISGRGAGTSGAARGDLQELHATMLQDWFFEIRRACRLAETGLRHDRCI